SLTTAMADALPAWTHTDFCDFRTVGCGAGGLGQVVDVGLLDILRELLPLGGSDSQFMFQDGINELTRHFYAQSVLTPAGQQISLQSLDAVRFNTPVMQVTTGKNGTPLLTYRDQNTKQAVTEEFAAVIVATSVHAMELLGLTLDTSAHPSVIASP